MADEILFPEWRNSHENVNYPFADGATMVNIDGKGIDRDLFEDARLWVVGSDATLYLKRIYVAADEMRFYFANDDDVELAYGYFEFDSIPANGKVPVVDLYGRPSGVLISTQYKLSAAIGQYPSGSTAFPPEASMLAPSVVVPMPDVGIRGFILDDGNAVTGDVYLVGDNGIVLSTEDGAIRVDVIGDAFAKHLECEEQDPIAAFCGVRTINYIQPDVNRDFKFFTGGNASLDNILRIEVEGSQLKISSAKSIGLQNG